MAAATAAGVLDMERRLIIRFRQRSLPWWPEGYPQSDWEQLFAMQHYGVPTRLLDWTENALSGLYFASDHDRARCECRTGTCWPTLWVLNTTDFNRLNKRLDGIPVQIFTPTPQEGAPTEFWRPGVAEGKEPRDDAEEAARELARALNRSSRFATGLATADQLVKTLPLGRKLMRNPPEPIATDDL